MAEVRQLIDMGFSEVDARRALREAHSDVERAVERLLAEAAGEPEPPPPVTGPPPGTPDSRGPPASQNARGLLNAANDDMGGGGTSGNSTLPPPTLLPIKDAEDLDLNAALELSMREQQEGLAPALDVPKERGLPCGLLNIGNTCYVNSLLQTFMQIDEFRGWMLRYRSPEELPPPPELAATGGKATGPAAVPEPEAEEVDEATTGDEARRVHCVRLAAELRRLSAYGLFSERSCLDPSRLLAELVDRRGQQLPIGSQEDVGESMLKLLEQLDDGLKVGSFIEPPTIAAADPAVAPSSALAHPPAAATVSASAATPPASPRPQADAMAVEGGAGPGPPGPGGGKLGTPRGPPGTLGGESTPGAALSPWGPPTPAHAGSPRGPPTPGGAGSHSNPATPRGATAPARPLGPAPATAAAPAVSAPPSQGAPAKVEVAPEAGEKALDQDAPEDGPSEPEEIEKSPSPPSLLQKLFFGEQVQVFSYRESAARPAEHGTCGTPRTPRSSASGAEAADKPQCDLVVSEERSDFLQIFLDVKHRDLYTAWEAANNTEVDYTTPSGKQATGSTRIWIRRLPKLLFFQLQRVAFDQEKKAQVKLDDAFDFDETIYVDRFLFEHRERASQVAAATRELQARREQLQHAMDGFEAFRGRPGLAADDVLSWTADCVERNAKALAAPPGSPRPGKLTEELRHPDRLAAAPGGARLPTSFAKDAPAAARVLRALRDACQEQVRGLSEELETLTSEISGAYSAFQSLPYELYAIWVHSGIAGSGHYLAYVRDWQHQRWVRFDDAVVSVVPWEDLRSAAIGQSGSHTSAYVLVYVERALALQEGRKRPEEEVLSTAESLLPPGLTEEIRRDNEALQSEQVVREARMAEQELRRHAEAVFQHYAGLVHRWEPLKRHGDQAGNPHDQKVRKTLNDPALLRFELFLYRRYSEQEVFTFLLAQSLEAQRQERVWGPAVEGRILFFLLQTIRSQRCYSGMLREKTEVAGFVPEAELLPLDMDRMSGQYNEVLIQAHIVDEALQMLRADRSKLLQAIATLALVWARWNLDIDDKFRLSEVLLLMSSLIYNVINVLEKHHSSGVLTTFRPACEYFMLLLLVVEWPKTWKSPLMTRVTALYPHLVASALLPRQTGQEPLTAREHKEAVLNHPLTKSVARWEDFEGSRPEPGEDFFERHRQLYSWVMHTDEEIATEFMATQAGPS